MLPNVRIRSKEVNNPDMSWVSKAHVNPEKALTTIKVELSGMK